MTREEALKIWLPVIKMGVESMQECSEAFDMAIKALEQEPKLRQALEQEKGAYNALVKDLQCSDCISRQAVLNLAKFDGRDGLGSIIHAFDVEQLPPVTPAEKVGQWIDAEVLDKIRAEIEQNAYPIVHGVNNHEKGMTLYGILQIVDRYKYKAESEE